MARLSKDILPKLLAHILTHLTSSPSGHICQGNFEGLAANFKLFSHHRD